MITGVVTANREATIRLVVVSAAGSQGEIEAIIDTGFTGFLTLPPPIIASLGMVWVCRQQGILADGSVRPFDVYAATLVWDGRLRTVETEATDAAPLVGMGLIYGHDLRIRAVSGGTVTIEALP